MLLPDMRERNTQPGFPFLDQLGGLTGRPIVGDHHLELAVILAGKRAQHGVERVRAIEGGRDDRYQVRHGRSPPA
jgi:hypothetical protein